MKNRKKLKNDKQSSAKQPWIAAGYHTFAYEGPQSLKIESLARAVTKSKSSFYHLFGELDLFIHSLLEYHLERVQIIAVEEGKAKSIDPELIHVLLNFKTDILFSRRLRLNREVSHFTRCFEKANELIGDAFIGVWANDLNLKDRTLIATNLYEFALENFYLQVTEENLNYEWLSNYFKDLRSMVTSLKNQ